TLGRRKICVSIATVGQNDAMDSTASILARDRIVIGALQRESRGLLVVMKRAMAGVMAGALVATGVLVAPAFGAAERAHPIRRTTVASSRFAGSFTPAAADPRLAAVIARGGM